MRKGLTRGTIYLCAAALLAGPAIAAELEDAVAKGAKLFADPSIGTNGKSCASCHGEGRSFAGKPGFPRIAMGKVRTLDQTIQTCIVNAEQGQALAWDDVRLTELAAFLDARSRGK